MTKTLFCYRWFETERCWFFLRVTETKKLFGWKDSIKMKIFKVSVFLCSLILPCITVTQSDDRCDEYEVNVSGETEHRDVFRRVKREFVPYKTGKLVARQVSNALDHLLFFSGYDKRIRPQVRLNHILLCHSNNKCLYWPTEVHPLPSALNVLI